MTSRTRLIVLLVSAPVIVFVALGGFLGKVIAHQEAYPHLRVFEDVVSLITNNYVEKADTGKVMSGAMRGLAQGLDEDSAFVPAEQMDLLGKSAAGGGDDTGVELTRQYYLRVVAARDDSPAARAGLRTGDYIRAIDSRATREMSVIEGRALLRGAPGTKVALTVIRSNAADPHVVEIVRAPVPAPKVTARLAASGVGYVRIPGFFPQVTDQVRAAIAEVKGRGATHVIIDVRDCATGDLASGADAARLFVPRGTVAFRESKGSPREAITAKPGDGEIAQPVTLLVDAGTAGASEVFAAALAGNERAELIGEKTHGRAALQKLVPLPDGSGLWLSSTWYLTPAGTPIHEKGLTPDVEVAEPDEDFGAPPPTGDPILEKALERVTSKVAGQASPSLDVRF